VTVRDVKMGSSWPSCFKEICAKTTATVGELDTRVDGRERRGVGGGGLSEKTKNNN